MSASDSFQYLRAGNPCSNIEPRDLKGKSLHIGQADIEDCFYQCGIPLEFVDYSCLESVPDSFAQDLGYESDIHGVPLTKNGRCYPVLKVLPMGWSWAFYIVQTLHEELIEQAGFDHKRCLVSNWPSPDVNSSEVAVPYCDNITIIGFEESAVNNHLQHLIDVFANAGFTLHDIEWASRHTSVLGIDFLGDSLVVRPKRERVHKLRLAIKHAVSIPSISGQEIEVLLGHFVFIALLSRQLLSIPQSLYRFICDSYNWKQGLWASAKRELIQIAALLPLVHANIEN